jgi:hypothetical protein
MQTPSDIDGWTKVHACGNGTLAIVRGVGAYHVVGGSSILTLDEFRMSFCTVAPGGAGVLYKGPLSALYTGALSDLQLKPICDYLSLSRDGLLRALQTVPTVRRVLEAEPGQSESAGVVIDWVIPASAPENMAGELPVNTWNGTETISVTLYSDTQRRGARITARRGA